MGVDGGSDGGGEDDCEDVYGTEVKAMWGSGDVYDILTLLASR